MHAGDVVGDGIPRLRYVLHFLGRHVKKLRAAIDEARDEPRAGDAIDLRPLARDPARVGVLRLAVQRPLLSLPALLDAALEVARLDSALAQRPRDALADFMAVHAVHARGAGARERFGPCRYALRLATQRPADHFGGRPERGRAPDVDHEGRVG